MDTARRLPGLVPRLTCSTPVAALKGFRLPRFHESVTKRLARASQKAHVFDRIPDAGPHAETARAPAFHMVMTFVQTLRHGLMSSRLPDRGVFHVAESPRLDGPRVESGVLAAFRASLYPRAPKVAEMGAERVVVMQNWTFFRGFHP